MGAWHRGRDGIPRTMIVLHVIRGPGQKRKIAALTPKRYDGDTCANRSVMQNDGHDRHTLKYCGVGARLLANTSLLAARREV